MNKIIIGSSDAAKAFQILSGFERIDELTDTEYEVYFLLHENDSKNVKDVLKIYHKFPTKKMYAILVDSQLGLKLKQKIINFDYFIPSELVADKFIEAIKDAKPTTLKLQKTKFKISIDPWFKTTLKVLLWIILISTLFFRFYFNYSFGNALYFTLVQIVTGGDTSLMQAPALIKIVSTLVMICGFLAIGLTVALFSNYLDSKKQELMWGIKKYKGKNHVIVIGGGAVGYNVIKKLLLIGETPILVDKSITGPFIKAIKDLGVPFLIGDARINQTLIDAGLGEAKAVLAVTDNDLVNLEVGLDTKILDPDLRVVLRIFDYNLADDLRHTGLIQYSYSMSYTAADYLMQKVSNE